MPPPRDQEIVLDELRTELKRIPSLSKPDLTAAIRLGCEADWPSEVELYSYYCGHVFLHIVDALRMITTFPCIEQEDGVYVGAGLGPGICGQITYRFGPWTELVRVLLAWSENFGITIPKAEDFPAPERESPSVP